MDEEKQCIICGEIQNVDDDTIQCCCGYSMFYKHDLDMLRRVGWKEPLKD